MNEIIDVPRKIPTKIMKTMEILEILKIMKNLQIQKSYFFDTLHSFEWVCYHTAFVKWVLYYYLGYLDHEKN